MEMNHRIVRSMGESPRTRLSTEQMLAIATNGTSAERWDLAGTPELSEVVATKLSTDEDLAVITSLLMANQLAEQPLRDLEVRLGGLGVTAGPESPLTSGLGEQENASIEAKLAVRMSALQPERLDAALVLLEVPVPARERVWAIWRKDLARDDWTLQEVLSDVGFQLPNRG